MVLNVSLAGQPMRVAAHFYHEAFNPAGRFSHRTTVLVHFGACVPERPEGTRCEGTIGPRGEGQAICMASDQFEKAVGRRLALERAIRMLLPGPHQRRPRGEIWDAYLQATRVKRTVAA